MRSPLAPLALPVLLALHVLLALPAAAEIQWTAPEAGVVGSPVQAAWADVLQEEPRTLGTHVETRVRILEGDRVVFESGSVHEHDGFHSLAWTPSRTGPLTLQVTPAEGSPVEHTVQVEAAAPATADQLDSFGSASLARDGFWLVADGPGIPVHSSWDLRDPAGRLLLSSTAVHPGTSAQGPDTGALDGTLRALATAGGGSALGLRVLEAPVQPGDAALVPPPLVSSQAPVCTDLVTDPDSATPDEPTWQRWSDVRVSVAPPQATVVYKLLDRTLPLAADPLWTTVSSAPHGALAFRAPSPGAYSLVLAGDVECRFDFRVVAAGGAPVDLLGAEEASGRVEAEIVVEGHAAEVTLVPRGADGATLSHYEFDTRVLRQGVPDGLLVWQGKLHGHAGTVSFRLDGLAPGSYEVHTYPSPQDMTSPPVAAQDPRGFVYVFEVAADADAPQLTPTAAVPALPVAALLAVLASLVLLRRGGRL